MKDSLSPVLPRIDSAVRLDISLNKSALPRLPDHSSLLWLTLRSCDWCVKGIGDEVDVAVDCKMKLRVATPATCDMGKGIV
jgi:hypothetical protein